MLDMAFCKKNGKGVMFLVKLGIVSRLLVYSVSIFAFYVFPTYDHSTEVAIPLESLSTFLHPFVRWDSLYFLQIAYNNCTYRFEPEYAFFPLYPFLMNHISRIFSFLSRIDALVMSGIAISCLSFLCCIILLYFLTIEVFQSEVIALLSCVLLIISPASIFLTALYSESLFFMLSLVGMLCFIKEHRFAASFLFALSSSARSNGLFHAGFFLYDSLLVFLVPGRNGSIFGKFFDISFNVLYFLLSLSGFGIFQWYGYDRVCLQGLNASKAALAWCANPPLVIPLLYQFVQKEYWDVGFLQYYQWKQLPNFLIAGPMILSLAYSTYRYPAMMRKMPFDVFIRTFPFLIEWIVVGVLTITTAHVQIVTRLFCSFAPMLYWTWAFLIAESFKSISKSNGAQNNQISKRLYAQALLAYVLGNGIIGCFLFACFYPPA